MTLALLGRPMLADKMRIAAMARRLLSSTMEVGLIERARWLMSCLTIEARRKKTNSQVCFQGLSNLTVAAGQFEWRTLQLDFLKVAARAKKMHMLGQV